MPAPTLKDLTGKIKPPEKKAEPVEAEDPEKNSAIAKALIGLAPIALGAAFGGSEGGAIGAKAGQKGLDIMEEQERSEAQREVDSAKAAAAAKEKAFDQQLKLRELAIKEREAQQKGAETSGLQGRLAKLSGEKAGRLDNSKAALIGVLGMKKALGEGQNTFSLVGENDFTMASNIFEEMLGRMQSGGQISQQERASFQALRPTIRDSKDIQDKKLAQLENMMRSRMQTIGFAPEEFPEVQTAYAGMSEGKKKAMLPGLPGIPSAQAGARPIEEMSEAEIDAELASRKGVR